MIRVEFNIGKFGTIKTIEIRSKASAIYSNTTDFVDGSIYSLQFGQRVLDLGLII